MPDQIDEDIKADWQADVMENPNIYDGNYIIEVWKYPVVSKMDRPGGSAPEGAARRPLRAFSSCERGKRNSEDDAHQSVPSRHRCC